MFPFLIIFLSIIGLSTYFILLLLKRFKPTSSPLEKTAFFIFIFSNILFVIDLLFHSNQYYTAIDPVDSECYIPFGGKHIYSLLFYYLAYIISAFLIWTKVDKLPPIPKVLSIIFILIGFILSIIILIQIAGHDISTFDIYSTNDSALFVFAPLTNIFVSMILFSKTLNHNRNHFKEKIYKSIFLNYCNKLLNNRINLQLWALILLAPITVICTIILILFGQDSDSLVKVFTETATWTFSQKQHPPILDHQGHYLCTVAAVGNPKIVKPLFIGKRHGQTIIVNRQLQIANAFEEVIHDYFPKAHRFIRINYDKYGYNLSLRINAMSKSNITYILMKPLEYTFLLFIYCFSTTPEEKIKKQYR